MKNYQPIKNRSCNNKTKFVSLKKDNLSHEQILNGGEIFQNGSLIISGLLLGNNLFALIETENVCL